MRLFWATFAFAAALCSLSALDLSSHFQGCTPAQDAVFKQVEDTILNLLTSHATLETVEAAVSTLVPDGSDVDLIINDAISFLHDTGALPQDVWPTAQAMQTAIGAKTVHLMKGATK